MQKVDVLFYKEKNHEHVEYLLLYSDVIIKQIIFVSIVYVFDSVIIQYSDFQKTVTFETPCIFYNKAMGEQGK